MALIDDFKTNFPQFDTDDVDAIFPQIETIYPCIYGFEYGSTDCNDVAVLQLCAHLFVVINGSQGGDNSPAQLPASESVGNVSVSYQGTIDTSYNNMLATTIYGQTYLMLISPRQGAKFV